MEVPGAKNHKLLVCAAEAFGTFVLVTAVYFSTGTETQAWAIGLALFSAAMLIGSVSGCHINPAVTMGVLIQNGLGDGNIVVAAMVMASQIVGGLISLVFIRLNSSVMEVLGISIPNVILMLMPSEMLMEIDGVKVTPNWFKVALVEVYGTFLFVSCILMIKSHQGCTEPGVASLLNCLACGMSLFAQVITIGGVSGGCLNPAVGFNANLYMTMFSTDGAVTMMNFLVYILAPLAGGFLAGVVHKILTSFKEAIEQEGAIE